MTRKTRSAPKREKMKASDYFALLRLRSKLIRLDSEAAQKAIEVINKKIDLTNY